MGIKIDLSFVGSKVQGMTCLSLQVFFWQVGRVVQFPSWLLKSGVREPEGGKAAAAKPSPLCFHLRDIPLRGSDSDIVRLFSEVPVSVIAHGFTAKAFPHLVGLHSKTLLHANSTGRVGVAATRQMTAGWPAWMEMCCAQPGAGELWLLPWQQLPQCWPPAALVHTNPPILDNSLSGNLNLQFSNTPKWRQVVSFPSALEDV